MQKTLLKLISIAGVVAIGTLVVVEVQKGLSSADVTTAGDALPFENDEQLSDAETVPSDFEQQMAINNVAIGSIEAGLLPDFADLAPFAADDNGGQLADSDGQFTQAIAFTEETETTGDGFLNFAVDSSEEVSEKYDTEPLDGTTGDRVALADDSLDDTRMQELPLGSIQGNTSSLADDANDVGRKNFRDDLAEPQNEPIPEPRMSLSQSGDVNPFEFYTPNKNGTATADSASPFEMEEDVASSTVDLLSLDAPDNGIADSTPPGPMPVNATDNPTRFFDETNPSADDSLSEQELIVSNADNAQMFGREDSKMANPLPFVEESSAVDIRRDRTPDPTETDTRDSEPSRVRLDSPSPLRLDDSPPGVPERNSGRSQFNFDSTEEPASDLPFPTDEPGRSPSESPRDPVKPLRELPPQRTLPERLRNHSPHEEPAVRDDRDTIEIRSRGELRREEPPTRRRREIDLADSSSTGVLRPHVTVRKQMPRAATLGKPLNYTLVITNEGQTVAEDVIVEDIVPVEATLEGVAPPADYEKKTRTIIWEFAELESGDSRELKVRITPTGQGVLKSVATVRFKTQATTSTIVHAPRLTLELVAPREIRVGHKTQIRYIVRNEGDGVATDVMLRSDLPAGLQHPIGNDLEYNIETLAPNDKREIVLDVIASKPGSHTSTAELIVSGSNGETAQATVNIIGQQIQVARRGPERRYVGRSAIYENILSNETAFEASQIRVVEYVPAGMRFEKATHNGIHNPEDRTVTWTLNQLDAGDSKTLKVQLVAMKSGNQESSVTVLENEGFETEARHVTAVEDLHNIGSRMSRLDGPVSVGDEFGFDIAVQNRGTADATNLQLTIDLANGMKGVSVGKGGPRADPRMNNGQLQYDFQAIDRIGPGEEMIVRINLKATKSISNGLVKARIRYDQMQKELVMSEAVTAIDDTP